MRDFAVDPYVINSVDWGLDTSPGADLSAVTDAIDGLPEDLRKIVEGVFYEQAQKATLARRYGLTRAEVDRRLKKAFEILREQLCDVIDSPNGDVATKTATRSSAHSTVTGLTVVRNHTTVTITRRSCVVSSRRRSTRSRRPRSMRSSTVVVAWTVAA